MARANTAMRWRGVKGESFTDYEADEYLRSAVERQFEIVGEAINQLRGIDPETATAMPELPRVIAFRHILVHRLRKCGQPPGVGRA